jgi:molybdopterin/thiamine biosynthesis adenylyltransferase
VCHGAIVFGQSSRDARVWIPGGDRGRPVDEVVVVGDVVEVITPTSARSLRSGLAIDEVVARQVLALGEVGNEKVSRLRIGVIGGGGVGSVVFDGIVRIGVAEVVVVDGDKLTRSNVSREEGAFLADAGQLKVQVLQDVAGRVGFGTRVRAVACWAQEQEAVGALLDCDVIVVGTDNMKSRVFASRLGTQYLIPVVSVGIDIVPDETGAISAIGGHVAVQYPDGPCLDCLGLIDHDVLQCEEMSRTARAANAYLRGRDPEAPAPSVFVFNQVVGGLVGIELLQLATGRLRRLEQRTYLMLDGCTGETRRVAAKRVRACDVCGQVRGWGDRFALPTG